MADLSKIDWSKVNIKHTYVKMTPEQTAYYKEQAEIEDQDMEWVRAEAQKGHAEAMRNGTIARTARFVLMHERNRQGLSDEEMMARSGLDAASLASMRGRDANPTLQTMEAYARALGKTMRIIFDDAEAGA